ncbi:MAG: hypothetical protein AAGF78_13370 [Pseudomonadota bacterium]
MTRILAIAAIGAIALAGCTRSQEQGDLPVRTGPQVQDPSSGFRVVTPADGIPAATDGVVPAAPTGGIPGAESVTLGEDLVG